MPQTVVYEQPLSEPFRHCLQLEHYFRVIQQILAHNTISIERFHDFTILQSLVGIVEILERKNIREALLREIKAKKKRLKTLLNHPEINPETLEKTLFQLETLLDPLQTQPGKVPEALRQNYLLNAIRNKMTIFGTACQLELPRLRYWLHLDTIQKKQS